MESFELDGKDNYLLSANPSGSVCRDRGMIRMHRCRFPTVVPKLRNGAKTRSTRGAILAAHLHWLEQWPWRRTFRRLEGRAALAAHARVCFCVCVCLCACVRLSVCACFLHARRVQVFNSYDRQRLVVIACLGATHSTHCQWRTCFSLQPHSLH